MGTAIFVIVMGIVSIVIAKCLDRMWKHEEAYNWQKLIVWGIGVFIPMIVDFCIAISIAVTLDIASDDSTWFAFTFSLCWGLVQFVPFLLVYHFKSLVEWMKGHD